MRPSPNVWDLRFFCFFFDLSKKKNNNEILKTRLPGFNFSGVISKQGRDGIP
jgi:hypothetical protein